jgi:hypothetical protein
VSTQAACRIANVFFFWVSEERRRWAEQDPADHHRFENQPRFSSYEDAHYDWLFRGPGLDAAAGDYGLAVANLLEIITQLDEDRLEVMPLVTPTHNEARWDHMTEGGFRQLVYENKLHQQPRVMAVASS